MVGCIGALRSAVLVDGKVNPVQPATRLIDLNGGSSQTNNEDAIMSTNQTPEPEDSERPIKGALTAHRVMFELWERTASILSTEELDVVK